MPAASAAATASPTRQAGSTVSWSSSSATGSSLPSTYARRNPAKSIVFPVAVKMAVSPAASAENSTVVFRTRASVIWDAIVRFQISS